MSKPKPAPLPSGTVVGGYQVIKKLAAGGFGVVYLCEDSERKLVALKEYLPSSLAERSPGELTPRVKPEKQPLYRLGLKSFFEEGRSLAQISHTSVVSVLNFFRENETVYMVMNYLQGDTLQDFIVTARDLKRDKVFRESCTSTRCCTSTSSPRTYSSRTRTRRCCSTSARPARCCRRKATSSARCTHRASPRPRCTAATARSVRGPTSTRSAPASTPACRVIRRTMRRSGSRRIASR